MDSISFTKKTFFQKRKIFKGFTLTELLVVIAIISILTVLVLSISSSLRQKSQSVACQANLRTIFLALSAYITDHNGALIPAAVYAYDPSGSWYSPNGFFEGGFWYTQLDPYVSPGIDSDTSMRANKRDVWPIATRAKYVKWQLCPSKNPKMLGNADDYKAVGYGWNSRYFGSSTQEGKSTSIPGAEYSRMSQVEKPSDTIIIGDSKDAEDTYQAYQNQYLYESETAGGLSVRPRRHSGGGNFLFLDGHIEWMTPDQINQRVKEGVFKKVKTK